MFTVQCTFAWELAILDSVGLQPAWKQFIKRISSHCVQWGLLRGNNILEVAVPCTFPLKQHVLDTTALRRGILDGFWPRMGSQPPLNQYKQWHLLPGQATQARAMMNLHMLTWEKSAKDERRPRTRQQAQARRHTSIAALAP